jgi:hypothetical protein
MRWPLVMRRRHEHELAQARTTIRERDRQLARLGHKLVEVKRAHAKLLTDLRLVRVQLDYPQRAGDRIGFMFQLPEAVFDGFRGDRDFVGLVAYMVEDAMRRSPEGRRALAGIYRTDARL